MVRSGDRSRDANGAARGGTAGRSLIVMLTCWVVLAGLIAAGAHARPTVADSPAAANTDIGVASAAVPGQLSAPSPTLRALSVVWAMTGDSNRNSRVTVQFRRSGATSWRRAMPLRRVRPGSSEARSWTYRHAGSIFNLRPGVRYEVRARLTDPDGPDQVRTITATTRRVPTLPSNPRVRPATPATLFGLLDTARAGDVIDLGPGTYDSFTIERSGTPARPIVVRSTRGAVVNTEVNLFSQHDVQVRGLTVRGRIRFNGSDRVAVVGNTVNSTRDRADGIVTYLRSEDSYIADNTVNGVTPWRESSLGNSGDNRGEGILVTGPGHVIEHNRVSGMRDGIGFLEDEGAVDQYSIDVTDNDIRTSADDGIEADFCEHNCRIIGNRLTNSFVAMSSQPSLGGPTYFIRNVAYNVVHVGFKLYRESHGNVLLHNTVVKSGDAMGIYAGRPIRHTYSRNNLFIGGPGGTYNGFSNGSGAAIQARDLQRWSYNGDYDGFGSTTGAFAGRLGPDSFDSLATLRARTRQTHAQRVGLGVFATPPVFPSNPLRSYSPPDLRLKSSSVAVDRGQRLPTINNYGSLRQGSTADLGAHEAGAPLPEYGPR